MESPTDADPRLLERLRIVGVPEETIRRRYYWQHRECGMGLSGRGAEELAMHDKEQLLCKRVLHPAGAEDPTEWYTLYEYEGTTWSSGQWSQKLFPRAILVLPNRLPRYPWFKRRFEHLGCEFEICDHMSFTIFHLEERDSREQSTLKFRDGSSITVPVLTEDEVDQLDY